MSWCRGKCAIYSPNRQHAECTMEYTQGQNMFWFLYHHYLYIHIFYFPILYSLNWHVGNRVIYPELLTCNAFLSQCFMISRNHFFADLLYNIYETYVIFKLYEKTHMFILPIVHILMVQGKNNCFSFSVRFTLIMRLVLHRP